MINSYGEKTVYTYTGDLITKKTIYDGAVIKSTYDYTYEDGKLKSVLTSAYDKNKTTGIITVYQQKFIYIHNSNGTVLEENFSIDPKTGTETKSGYSSIYTFSNGNLMKTVDTSPYQITTSEYEYDNNKNPFVNITGFSKNNFNSVNNITKITTINKDTSNGVEVTTTTTRNYTNTYDINDFLTVRRLTFTNSAGVTKGADEYFFYE